MAQSDRQSPGDTDLEQHTAILESLIEDNYVILNAFKSNMQDFKVSVSLQEVD